MNRLVLIRAQVEEMLRRLSAHQGAAALFRVGRQRQGQHLTLLGHTPRLRVGSDPTPAVLDEDRATLALSADPLTDLHAWGAAAAQAPNRGHWLAHLVIGIAGARGQIAARLLSPEGSQLPLQRLDLVGARMERLVLATEPAGGSSHAVFPAASRERWSRSQGALGAEAWRRLVTLRYGLVGCGRNGSLLAQSLAALGVQHLTLADPDRLEQHNLGEMAGVMEARLGEPKAVSLAAHLTSAYPWTHVTPVLASVTARRALTALLDIGASVLIPDRSTQATMGADVRLLLPGDGCLLCWGGVADPGEAGTALSSLVSEETSALGRDWQHERAGSLRSLNQIAVGLGMRLWEDLVAERGAGSRWLRLEFDALGTPNLTNLSRSQRQGCPLCAATGSGDARRLEVVRSLLPELVTSGPPP